MNGYQYILAKQTEWAKNQGLDLIGSKINRGRPTYTINLDYNLFQPLLPNFRTSFAAGDGNELGSSGLPGKMQAIHSSSALGVNVFQYWKSIPAVPMIAAACGLCKRGRMFLVISNSRKSIRFMTALVSILISMSSSTTSQRQELSGLPLSVSSLRRMGHTSTLDLNRSTWIVAIFGTTFPTCELLHSAYLQMTKSSNIFTPRS